MAKGIARGSSARIVGSRALRIVLIGAGALLALLLGAAVWIARVFDPNAYKPQLIEWVDQRLQRTLTLDGDIRISFFPSLGAQAGPVSLSEADRRTEFAGADRIRVSVKVLPLLRGRVVIDEVLLLRPRATLVERKDGSRNVDDLLAAGKPADEAGARARSAGRTEQAGREQAAAAAAPPEIDVARIVIDDGSFVSRSERAGSELRLSALALTTGRLGGARADPFTLGASVQATPSGLELKVEGKGQLLADPAAQRYGASALVLTAAGTSAQVPIALRLDLGSLTVAPGALQLDRLRVALRHGSPAAVTAIEASVPSLATRDGAFTGASLGVVIDRKGSGDSLNVRIGAPLQGRLAAGGFALQRLDAPEIKADVEGRIGGKTVQGAARAQFAGDFATGRHEFGRVALKMTLFGLDAPVRDVAVTVDGAAAVHAGGEPALSASLLARINDTTLRAKLGRSGERAPLVFDVEADQFDLDRYRAPRAAATGGEPGKGEPGKGEPVATIDFGFLRGLHLAGTLRAVALKSHGVRLSNARIDVRAADGRLDLAPIAASLYSGRVEGSLALVDARPPRIELRQTLSGVQVGPLLDDAAKINRIEGRGDVRLDLAMQGSSVPALKRSLAGSAAVSLADGAVRGVNIGAVLRDARGRLAQLGGRSVQPAAEDQRTDFSEFRATFALKEGVARNSDLSMKSPLLRAAGEGTIDIGADRIDYLLRPTIVGTLGGQGARDVDLRGLTVPVHISGPLAKPQFDFDLQAMLVDSAKQAVQQRVGELLQQQLGGKPGGESARPGAADVLKGMLGR